MKKYIIFLITLIILINPGSIFANDQFEENGYLHNIQSVTNGIIYTDNYGSAIYIHRNGQTQQLTATRGSGLYYAVSPDKNAIAYKEINEQGNQRPALLDMDSGNIRYLADVSDRVGQPGFLANGELTYTLNTRLIITDGREFDLGVYSNLAPVSPDGEYVCFNDDEDQIWIMDLNSARRQKISPDEGGYYYPQWSRNSRFVLFIGFDSRIYVYDRLNAVSIHVATGHEPRWSNDSETIVFYQKEIENFELINSDIYLVQRDGSNLRRITYTADDFEIDPVFSDDDSRIIYHQLGSRNVHMANLNSSKTALTNEQVLSVSIAGKKDLPAGIIRSQQTKNGSPGMPIPYLHQVYDVPNWFWGYYACAPTAAAMLLAYHNILPKWHVRCSSPYTHSSYWGRYICERYYYREKDYYYSSSPAGHTAGKGGYGYMWGTGGSPNSRMADYYRFHGLGASQEWNNTNWNTAITNINSGNPYTMCVWLTSSGHLILARGTVEGRKTLIFNDPYGDKNTAGYPSYDGEAVYYDWPGYNEGNVNLASAGSGIPWTIATTYNALSRADTLVDDKHLENGFYLHTDSPSSMSRWKDKKSGYNNHYWYCDSRISTDLDTSYAEWTPDLPNLGWYDVYVYIPANENATTNAVYRITHAAGIDTVSIDQSSYADEWVHLGEYICHSRTGSRVHLGDACGETGRVVLFDAVKFVPDRPVSIDFLALTLSGEAPLTVQFSNTTEFLPDNSQIIWTFGDGHSSDLREPLHIYREAGNFDVQMTVIYPDTVQSVMKNTYIQVDSAYAGDFSLIVPEPNSVLKTATPLFYWVPSLLSNNDEISARNNIGTNPDGLNSAAGDYLIYLHTNSDFREIAPISADTNYYKPDTLLDENQEYFWQVRYTTAANDTLSSAVWSFSIDTENSPPEAFALKYPAEEEVLTDLAPQFEWDYSEDFDVDDSLYYRMKLGHDIADFELVYEGLDNVYSMSDSLEDNRVYYWQVEAVDRSGAITIAGGGPKVFYTNRFNEPPEPPVLVFPKNGDYVFTQYPPFEWLAAHDPDPHDEVSYLLQFWPVGSIVRYFYGTDTTFCDIRRVKLDYEYYWCVEVEDSQGLTAMSDTFLLKTSSTGIEDEIQLPEEFALYQNSPNPFNPSTLIRFDIPEMTHVRITVYDLTGRRVRALTNRQMSAGMYHVRWDGCHADGSPAAAGVYIYTLESDQKKLNRKMLLLK